MIKLTCVFIITFTMYASANVLAQKVNISTKDASLKSVMRQIQQQTGYSFFIKEAMLREANPVTISARNEALQEVLPKVFKEQPFTYTMDGKVITVVPRSTKSRQVEINITTLPDVQQSSVRGRVLGENNEPLANVSVRVLIGGKTSSLGTKTDENGYFSLDNLKEDQRYAFIFSLVGFENRTFGTYSIQPDKPLQLSVTLKPQTSELDEVLVGYGSVKKKDLTGSVSSIDMEEFSKQPSFNFDVALAGRAPGVLVTRTSGAPGADASIRIRGASSVFGINEPLYVVDGVPIQIGQGMGIDDYRSNRSFQLSPLATINPQDIESIDILKDASGTAIYGSRGANGVIIITTKKGKGGHKPSLNVSYNLQVENFFDDFEMLTTDQLYAVAQEAYANAGTAFPTDFLVYPGVNTDWRKLVTRNANSNSLNVSLRGGSPNGQTVYAISASTNNQKGVIKSSDYNRLNVRTNIESEVVSSIKVGANVNYSKNKTNGLTSTYYYNVVRYRPDIPVFDDQGRYAVTPDSVQGNPVAKTLYTNLLEGDNLLLSTFGEWRPIEPLKLRSTISYNKTNNVTTNYTPSFDPFEIRNGRRGSRKDIDYVFSSVIFDNTLTYDKFFGGHFINAVAGASFTSDKLQNMNIESVNFPDDNVLNNLGSAGAITSYQTNGRLSGLESYFFRSNYNYQSKYYLTLTARTDKSTKFGPNNQWGFFPSGAVSWRVSQEKFIQDYDWVSDLKMRFSVGKTGSANLGDFLYATFFSSGSSNSFHNGNNGVVLSTVPNPSIRWETTTQRDFGIDFGFFNNRLRGAFDVYKKYTKDLLLNVPIPFETGASSQIMNIGDISNKGFEFVIGGDIISKSNFTYSSDINFSRNIGRLEKLNGGAASSLSNFKEGDLLGSVFGYQVEGIFQTKEEIDQLNAASPTNVYQVARTSPGDFKFRDVSGDGRISTEDIVNLGNVEPKFYGGWNNVFRYKGVELSALFYFSYGNLINNGAKSSLGIYRTDVNYDTSVLDAWTPENTTTSHPRNVFNDPNNNARTSDYFVQDASFVKLKNLQLAYRFEPGKWLKGQVNQIHVYASASNLFILTGYDGVDPEVSTSTGAGLLSGGYDNGGYPSTRAFNFGINVTF